jgi:proton translocating ATP synthase F1 alpha subunit
MSIVKYSFYGSVLSIKDGIVMATGLRNVSYGELVCFNNDINVLGMILTLEENTVEIVILTAEQHIQIGDPIYRMETGFGDFGKFPSVKVGYSLLGKHIDVLGSLLNSDDLSPEDIFVYEKLTNNYQNVFRKAPGIIFRESVRYPFYTGYQIIDNFFPIGCGQRELIIGDKFTGKTTIAITAILNQREANNDLLHNIGHVQVLNNYMKKNSIFCIYTAIGQRRSTVLRVYNLLKKEDSLYYTCVVSSTSSCKAVLQYLTPYVGTTIGEFFMSTGHNAFIVYDDLSNHSVAYRQMALLLRRPPGREAYPGDIFYLHSSLLERSSQMHKEYGGGSLTSFPIIETQCGDVSSYIPTNVISITDGQIYLDKNLFNRGIRPAVHTGLSVSRVGSNAQSVSVKLFAKKLKIQYDEFQRYMGSFTAADASADSIFSKILNNGLRLREVFIQRYPRSLYEQLVIGYTSIAGFTSKVIPLFINNYYQLFFNSNYLKQILSHYHRRNYGLIHIALYFIYIYPFKHVFNFFFNVYSIEVLRKVLKFDQLFIAFTKIFSEQFHYALWRVSKEKKHSINV